MPPTTTTSPTIALVHRPQLQLTPLKCAPQEPINGNRVCAMPRAVSPATWLHKKESEQVALWPRRSPTLVRTLKHMRPCFRFLCCKSWGEGVCMAGSRFVSWLPEMHNQELIMDVRWKWELFENMRFLNLTPPTSCSGSVHSSKIISEQSKNLPMPGVVKHSFYFKGALQYFSK